MVSLNKRPKATTDNKGSVALLASPNVLTLPRLPSLNRDFHHRGTRGAVLPRDPKITRGTLSPRHAAGGLAVPWKSLNLGELPPPKPPAGSSGRQGESSGRRSRPGRLGWLGLAAARFGGHPGCLGHPGDRRDLGSDMRRSGGVQGVASRVKLGGSRGSAPQVVLK